MTNMGTTKKPTYCDIENLQHNRIRIMNFKSKYAPSKLLFIGSEMLLFPDIVKSENCLLVL